MKPRRWILAVFFLFVVLGGGFFFGKLTLEKNRDLEHLLVQYISPLVGGTFTVEKVRLGFFSVDLSGVRLRIPLQSFTLRVQDIKIGFSFLKLIISRGDFSTSINKIILVDPFCDVSFTSNSTLSDSLEPAAQIGSLQPSFSMADFPVDYLYIKNCTVRLIDYTRDSMTIGEQLTGRIWEDESAFYYELRGKVAGAKKNLFLSGEYSRKDHRQHVSLRLEKARIEKPIRWRNISLVNGSLDGVCEFSFTDTVFPYNVDGHGRITLEQGVAGIEGLKEKVTDVRLLMKFSGDRIVFDTVVARYGASNVFIRGSTGFSPQMATRVSARLTGFIPSLIENVPAAFQERIDGDGWFELEARKRRNGETFTASFSAGDMRIDEKPVNRIVGKGSFTGKSATIDTIFLGWQGIAVGSAGLLNFEKSPFAYSFTGGLTADLAALVPGCSGTVHAHGNVHGLGDEPKMVLDVTGTQVVLHSFKCGNPRLSIMTRNRSVIVSTLPDGGGTFSCEGSIDSLGSVRSQMSFEVQCNRAGMEELFQLLPEQYQKLFDTTTLALSITGATAHPTIDGVFSGKGKNLSGSVRVRVESDSTLNRYRWRCTGDTIRLADTLVPFAASGIYKKDTLFIKTLSLMEGISGAGYVQTGAKGTMAMEIRCSSLPLDKFNLLFPGEEKLITKGTISGSARLFGPCARPKSRVQATVRNFTIASIAALETDVVIRTDGETYSVLPFVIRKNKRPFCVIDTVSNAGHLSFSGVLKPVSITDLLGNSLNEEDTIAGMVSGEFTTTDSSGLPLMVTLRSPRILYNSWKLDSVSVKAQMTSKGIVVDELKAVDSTRSRFRASGDVPWAFLTNEETEQDTMFVSCHVTGDLLATVEHNTDLSIGGTGKGAIAVEFFVTSEEMQFIHAEGAVPDALLEVDPFVPDKVKHVSCKIRMDNKSRLSVVIKGTIAKRPITIFNSHTVPKGFEPLMIGPLNCGIIYVRTPENGVPLYVPGFMEKKSYGDIDFVAKKPLPAFALSGPVDKLRITGVWLLRNLEFTYPPLEDYPLPNTLTWDFDLKAGNRKVIYFYNIGGKRKRLMRFTECYLEPSSSLLSVQGREIDGTFRLLGNIRSDKGHAFYGRMFDRNFDVGLDFAPQKIVGKKGYDNLPIIWGSAEAFSDSSRFDRIKLTLFVRDPETGAISEKGRFTELNFRVSSDFEEMPGDAELEFYRESGLNFTSFKRAGKKAGEMVSAMGDQYINRYFLQRVERRLAKRLGLDVFSFETSIASNYFNYLYNNQNQFNDLGSQWDYLAFANVGFTLGRYVLKDKVFFKWRTELAPRDLFLIPEHSIGFEYQPKDFLWVDFNYGFYKNENDLFASNPKLRMQLRLPITKLRKFFDF